MMDGSRLSALISRLILLMSVGGNLLVPTLWSSRRGSGSGGGQGPHYHFMQPNFRSVLMWFMAIFDFNSVKPGEMKMKTRGGGAVSKGDKLSSESISTDEYQAREVQSAFRSALALIFDLPSTSLSLLSSYLPKVPQCTSDPILTFQVLISVNV